jgi:hypothetical protein
VTSGRYVDLADRPAESRHAGVCFAASREEGSVRGRVAATVVASALVMCGAAVAVLPKKGSTLVGVIKSSPFEMKVNIGVSSNGTTLSHFTYLCGTGRPPTNVYGLRVDSKGYFSYTSKLKDWKLAGHFVTPTSAFVSLNSIACGGSKGSTTVKLK